MIARAHTHAGFRPAEPPNARRFASIFNPPSPPPPPPPPAPLPQADDPAVEEERRRRRLAEARRRGRQATILTGGEGDTAPATVARPELRRLLGGG